MNTFPPLVAVVASGAHIVGVVNTTLIAAPGVGFRLRIVGGTIGINRTSTGIVDESLAELASGTLIWRGGQGLSVAGTPIAYVTIPDPGFQMGDNQGLQLQSASTVATGATIATIYYYVDTVT